MFRLFNTFEVASIRGDLFGGVTAAVISLPMALAFGVASGAGPLAGLYGAILVGFFAAVFGGTSTLMSEPTGPMTVLMTAILTTTMANNPETGLAMAFSVVMVAGVFQILLGACKLGKYITLMPYSVISGFMSGIGLILIILQIAPFLGHNAPPGGSLETLKQLPKLINRMAFEELLLALMTLLTLFVVPKQFPKFSKKVPAPLVALVIGTSLSLLLYEHYNIRRIGEISVGLPTFYWPHFDPAQWVDMVKDGMILGALGCIDSLLTAVIADSLTRQEHNSNRELIGQGIGNLVSGLLGGLPGAGATMGTVVNIQSGARSPLSGVVRAAVLLIVVFGAAHLTRHIPLSVLAGIAVKVGVDILDWSFVKRAHSVSWQTAAVMYGVMLLTVFVDLIVAVGLGVFVANLFTIERLSALQMKNIKTISDSDDAIQLSPEEKHLLDNANGRILLVYLSGPMIFGVSKAIARKHNTIQQYQSVVLDLSDVPLMDTTVSLAIENMIKSAIEEDKVTYIVRSKSTIKGSLDRLGVYELIPCTQICDSRIEALRLAVTKI